MQRSSVFKIGPKAILFRDKGLEIHGLALEEDFGPRMADRPRGTGDQLLMCLHHDGQLGAETCRAEDMIIWARDQAQFYGSPGKLITHSWLHADGPWLSACFKRHQLSYQQCFPSGSRFRALLRGLHAELSEQRPPDGLILRSLIEAWARERSLAMHEPTTIPAWLPRLRAWLHEHLAEEISISDCCAVAGLKRARLCAQFTAFEGLSIGAWLQGMRLELACHHLRDENITVAEAGRLVGYPDTSYFCKLFQRRYGSSPGKWRYQ